MKKAENIALWNNQFTDRKASGLKVMSGVQKIMFPDMHIITGIAKSRIFRSTLLKKCSLKYLLRHLKRKVRQNKKEY